MSVSDTLGLPNACIAEDFDLGTHGLALKIGSFDEDGQQGLAFISTTGAVTWAPYTAGSAWLVPGRTASDALLALQNSTSTYIVDPTHPTEPRLTLGDSAPMFTLENSDKTVQSFAYDKSRGRYVDIDTGIVAAFGIPKSLPTSSCDSPATGMVLCFDRTVPSVTRVDPTTGANTWSQPGTPNVQVAGDAILLDKVQNGNVKGLTLVDAETGSVRWRSPQFTRFIGVEQADGDFVVVQSTDITVVDGATGAVAWSKQPPTGYFRAFTTTSDAVVVASPAQDGSTADTLTALSLTDGSIMSTARTDLPVYSLRSLSQGKVYVRLEDDQGFHILDPLTGVISESEGWTPVASLRSERMWYGLEEPDRLVGLSLECSPAQNLWDLDTGGGLGDVPTLRFYGQDILLFDDWNPTNKIGVIHGPASQPTAAQCGPQEPPPTSGTGDGGVFTSILVGSSSGPGPNPIVNELGSNFVGAMIASVKIIVKGADVVVAVCGTQSQVDAQTCDGYFDTVTINSSRDNGVWTGTRDGNQAKVVGADKYLWATVTFDGSGPSSTPVRFEMARDCVASDGSQGTLRDWDGCQ
ncbi:MAG: PQQ-like beta-propeller repeat protein [Propionibacteriaceae bacterium]|nr:PQQ-like beta-propeller repeat protein [Propionibacteriaceae bacterium]